MFRYFQSMAKELIETYSVVPPKEIVVVPPKDIVVVPHILSKLIHDWKDYISSSILKTPLSADLSSQHLYQLIHPHDTAIS